MGKAGKTYMNERNAEMYLLELQGSNLAREASNKAAHLPGPQRVSRCLDRTAFGLPIMLLQPTDGVGRATYV